MFLDDSRWESYAKNFPRSKRRAKFIAFEGIDGSGKSTIINKVANELKQSGYSVLVNQEPGTTPMGNKLRKLLKTDIPRAKRTELFIQEACRVDIIETRIIPNLYNYDFILNDRYTDSTIAYQGAGNGNDLGLINELNILATREIKPDLTFFIDTDLQLVNKRSKKQGDIDEFDRVSNFAKRVYNQYQHLANSKSIVKIPNNNSVDYATKLVMSYLQSL